MLEVGWTVFCHQKAGYKITSTAVQQVIPEVVNMKEMLQGLLTPLFQEIQEIKENNAKVAPYIEAGKLATTLYKYFPNYESLFKDVTFSIENSVIQEKKLLKEWLYSLGFRDLSHGEKITVSRKVCDFATSGDHDWFNDSPKKGRKKYHEALLPVIRDAVLYVLSKRNNVRLIK